MLKARNKKLSMLLVLAMLMTMFVGVGTASAAPYSYSGSGIVVEGDSVNLGSVIFDFPSLATGPHQVVVKLPEDFVMNQVYVTDLSDTPAISYININGTTGAALETAGIDVDGNMLVLSLGNTSVAKEVKFSLDFRQVTVPSSADDAQVLLLRKAGQFTDGAVAIGKVSSGNVDVIVTDPPTIKGAGNDPVKFNIREDKPLALDKGENTISFKLPKGFKWTAGATMHTFPPVAEAGKLPSEWGTYINTFEFDISDDSILKVTRKANAAYDSSAQIFTLLANYEVDENVANLDEVFVTVSGKSNIKTDTVKIGTLKDYGYTIKVKNEETELIAGRIDQEISQVNIKENIADSLFANRTVWAQLSAGVEWTENFKATAESGKFSIDFTVNEDDKSLAKGVINEGKEAKSLGEAKLKDIEVDVAADFTGPIKVEFYGNAGIDETITVGNVIAPVTGEAVKQSVIIGLQSQAAGNIVIKEAQKEAISSRVDSARTTLVLAAPRGVTWAKLPTVEVTEGDLALGTVKRVWTDGNTERHALEIEIRNQSSKPSTIEITDVFYTLDRTVPEGDLEISVTGTAVSQTNYKDQFVNRGSVAKVVAATVVTPAPGESLGAGEFVIGSNFYYVGGVKKLMDVAPYIKGERTYVPMRFLGEILGAEVVWDDAARTVTLTRGDDVVVFTVGSESYTVNGDPMKADVAPEIVNDRTMLPARFVAEGFGAIVGWDPGTQTVLIQN